MTVLAVDHFDGVPVARIAFDVDASNAGRVSDQLAACVPKDVNDLVVDLSQTRYLDSAGIDMLFRLHQRLSERRASLHLVIPPDSQLARLAAIVALPSAMPVHAGMDEALRAANGAVQAPDAA